MTTKSRRRALDNISLDVRVAPHPGLWLDKFLKEQQEQGGEGTKAPHFQEAASTQVSPVYRDFFNAWKQTLQGVGAVTKEAKTTGRLAIGLGGESVLETSITLHRTYGVPYIPGSALKGLAARYARTRLEDSEWREGKAYKILFGDTDEAGYVTFFDALYILGSAANDHPLMMDVMTVHHPEYYQGKSKPPADWDSPTPIPFLSATGSYLIALYGDDKWVEAALQILDRALREEGIGAKTSSGYGRMDLDLDLHATADGPEGSTEVNRFRARLESMAVKDVAGQIHSVYQDWKVLEVDLETKLQIAQIILDKLELSGRAKKLKRKKKPWFSELLAFVDTYSRE